MKTIKKFKRTKVNGQSGNKPPKTFSNPIANNEPKLEATDLRVPAISIQSDSLQEKGVVERKAYPSWDVNGAMRNVYDTGEMLMIFPILLGDVAYQIKNEQDIMFDVKLYEGQSIEWGLPQKNLTKEVISLFKTWGFKENEKGYTYSFEHIPVQVVVFKNKYPFFNNLDMKFYKIDEFKLPNPFSAYWESREVIQ